MTNIEKEKAKAYNHGYSEGLERGKFLGKLVFSHTQLMLIGKGMYPVNQYRCEGAHDEP